MAPSSMTGLSCLRYTDSVTFDPPAWLIRRAICSIGTPRPTAATRSCGAAPVATTVGRPAPPRRPRVGSPAGRSPRPSACRPRSRRRDRGRPTAPHRRPRRDLTVAVLGERVDTTLRQRAGPPGSARLRVTPCADRTPHPQVRRHRRDGGRVARQVDVTPGECPQLLGPSTGEQRDHHVRAHRRRERGVEQRPARGPTSGPATAARRARSGCRTAARRCASPCPGPVPG